MTTGWDERVRGGGGREYNGECLLDDDRDDDKYDNNNKMMMQRMGRDRTGEWTTGESDYDGHDVVSGPSIGGVGQRTLIVGPHAAAAVDDDDDRCHGRGASRPPLSGPSRPSGFPTSMLLMSPTAVDNGGTRVFGALLYAWCMEEEEEVCAVVLIPQVLIQPGVDDGGKRSSVTLVGLRGRQCKAGEGGGGGVAPQVR
jgi:hypothetical protein